MELESIMGASVGLIQVVRYEREIRAQQIQRYGLIFQKVRKFS